MIGGIDPAAGIAVFQPGATDGAIFLDDDEGNAGFLHFDRHAQAGHTGAGDNGLEGVDILGFGSPMHGFWIAVAEHRLFADHRHVFCRDRPADPGRKHPVQQMRRRFGRHFPTCRGIIQQDFLQPSPHSLLQRIMGILMEIPGAGDIRGNLVEPVFLSGQVHHRHQHRGHVGTGQSKVEQRFVVRHHGLISRRTPGRVFPRRLWRLRHDRPFRGCGACRRPRNPGYRTRCLPRRLSCCV